MRTSVSTSLPTSRRRFVANDGERVQGWRGIICSWNPAFVESLRTLAKCAAVDEGSTGAVRRPRVRRPSPALAHGTASLGGRQRVSRPLLHLNRQNKRGDP